MTNKFNNFKNIILIVLLFNQINLIAGPYLDNEINWSFVNYKFIIAPEERVSKTWPFMLKVVPALLLGIAVDEITVSLLENTDFFNKFLAYLFPSYFSYPKEESGYYYQELSKQAYVPQEKVNLKYSINITSGILSSLTVFKVYFMIHNSLKNQYEKEALLEFLENWEFYKTKCPLDLKNYIETIHDVYIKNSKLFDQNYQEEIRVIKKKINESLPKPLSKKDKFISYFKLAIKQISNKIKVL